MDNIFLSAILLVIKETLSKRDVKEKNKTKQNKLKKTRKTKRIRGKYIFKKNQTHLLKQ